MSFPFIYAYTTPEFLVLSKFRLEEGIKSPGTGVTDGYEPTLDF